MHLLPALCPAHDHACAPSGNKEDRKGGRRARALVSMQLARPAGWHLAVYISFCSDIQVLQAKLHEGISSFILRMPDYCAAIHTSTALHDGSD